MKDIDIPRLIFFEADCETRSMPPPYSYHYRITGRISKEKLAVNYQLSYTGRETLDEEEIIEEGFTPDDDISLQVDLPLVWVNALKDKLIGSGWLKQKPGKEEVAVEITLKDSQGNQCKGIPDNLAGWEYFLQEMIQALYEVGKKEMPLEIKYKEIAEGETPVWVILQPLFSTLKVLVKTGEAEDRQVKELPWKALKRLLRSVYIPFYDPEDYEAKEPVKPGKYIDIGEGKWYKFGQGAQNPGKGNDALERLEKQLKALL